MSQVKFWDAPADQNRVLGKRRQWFLALPTLIVLTLTTPAFGLGGLLGPLVEPASPITEVVDPITEPILEPVASPITEVVDPITEPILEPAEEVLDPITEPILEPAEEVLAPVTDPLLPPTPEEPVDEEPASSTTTIPPPAPVDSAGVDPATGADSELSTQPVEEATPDNALLAASWSLVSPAAGLPDVAATPSSLLGTVLDWVRRVDVGSVLAAPWLALQVLLRALASAGEGLLAPMVLLIGLAAIMGREKGFLGTKTA